MKNKVEVTVRGVYELGGNPCPVAFIRINYRLHDFYPCGTVHRRIKWLPRWLPFNTRYNYSLSSQMACVRMLRQKYTALAAELAD